MSDRPIDDRTRALIEGELDGELSAAEADELRQILEASPDARAYREESMAVHRVLENAPSVEPPAALHDQIMAAIPMAKRVPVQASPKRTRWWVPEVPAFFRYGMATMAGLVIAIGIYEMVPEVAAPVDPREVVGTIAKPSGPEIVAIDTVDLSPFGLTGSAQLQRRDNQLLLEFSLDASEPVNVDLSITGGGLTFGALAPAGTAALDIDSFEFSDSSLGALLSGKQTLLVQLDAAENADLEGSTIKVKLTGQQAGAWETELKPQPQNK